MLDQHAFIPLLEATGNIKNFNLLHVMPSGRVQPHGFVFEVSVFTPQPLRAVEVLFSPMVSGWAGGRVVGRSGGRREIVCPGCISETVRCRKFILGRDIGWGV